MPSGLNATAIHAAVVAGEWFADLFAAGGVPQPHRAIVAGGGEQGAVGVERHRRHGVVVAGEWFTDLFAAGGVPQPHRAIVAGGGEQVPSGLNATAIHEVVVAGEWFTDGLPLAFGEGEACAEEGFRCLADWRFGRCRSFGGEREGERRVGWLERSGLRGKGLGRRDRRLFGRGLSSLPVDRLCRAGG